MLPGLFPNVNYRETYFSIIQLCSSIFNTGFKSAIAVYWFKTLCTIYIERLSRSTLLSIKRVAGALGDFAFRMMLFKVDNITQQDVSDLSDKVRRRQQEMVF